MLRRSSILANINPAPVTPICQGPTGIEKIKSDELRLKEMATVSKLIPIKAAGAIESLARKRIGMPARKILMACIKRIRTNKAKGFCKDKAKIRPPKKRKAFSGMLTVFSRLFCAQ